MVRFFFLLTARLNVAGKTAATILDLNKVAANLAKGQSPLPTGCPESKNAAAHLAFFEISLLFGGHRTEEDPEGPPIHQM